MCEEDIIECDSFPSHAHMESFSWRESSDEVVFFSSSDPITDIKKRYKSSDTRDVRSHLSLLQYNFGQFPIL